MSAAITGVRLISRDAAALASFYVDALGFRHEGEAMREDPFAAAPVRVVVLGIGPQRVEIAEVAGPPGPVAPGGPGVAFQHFAMVTHDMGGAMARLGASTGWRAISTDGPQTLPARSGGVGAFKFRDPEGHPLEFLSFPAARVPAVWAGDAGVGPIAGIDHTAVVVAETRRSADHYRALGFEVTGSSLNEGSEQARLDGVAAPVVEVTALALPGAGPPHLELLCYRGAAPGDPVGDADVLATRTLLLSSAAAPGGQRDADGHRWIVSPPAG